MAVTRLNYAARRAMVGAIKDTLNLSGTAPTLVVRGQADAVWESVSKGIAIESYHLLREAYPTKADQLELARAHGWRLGLRLSDSARTVYETKQALTTGSGLHYLCLNMFNYLTVEVQVLMAEAKPTGHSNRALTPGVMANLPLSVQIAVNDAGRERFKRSRVRLYIEKFIEARVTAGQIMRDWPELMPYLPVDRQSKNGTTTARGAAVYKEDESPEMHAFCGGVLAMCVVEKAHAADAPEATEGDVEIKVS